MSAQLANSLRDSLLNHQNNNDHEHGYFIYDIDKIDTHLAKLNDQDVIKLWFAVKANPLSSVLQSVAKQGINFDVASLGELEHVMAQGVSSTNILNTGPAKSRKQLAKFLSLGVPTFVVESLNQLTWLNEEAAKQAKKPQVLLRVQLQWPEGEKNPLGGNALTPFGLSVDEWQQIKIEDYPSLNINGLHIFQWGNMLDNKKMFSLWSQMVEPLVSLAYSIGMTLEVLDLGGGLGVDYLATGNTIDWQIILEDLAVIKANAGVQELWLELGRYAVAEFGYYVTEVVDKKSNFNEHQLVLGAGINHLIRPAITDQPFPVSLLRDSDKPFAPFHIHGPLCTSLDSLGHLQLPNDVAVGDKLVFGFTGAYGFTESMPFFLCHEIAGEYIYQQGELKEIRAAQPANWYLR